MSRPFTRITRREEKETNTVGSEPTPNPALFLGEPLSHVENILDEKAHHTQLDHYPSSCELDGGNTVDSIAGGLFPAPLLRLAVSAQERWNDSPTSMFRYLAVIYSFLVMGVNDGVTGVSIPGWMTIRDPRGI